MKELIKISFILAIAITSLTSATFVNPLGSTFKSSDNGGTLSAIDSYKDGVGAVIVDNLMTINNSAMNTLVYKYGDAAKANNTTVVNQVMYGTGTIADKVIAGALTTDGSSCNDNNPATTGETWLNGICQSGNVILTWDNCEAGSTNGSLNYNNAVAYCSSKGMRLPILSETTAGGGTIPSCLGWTWTSTPYNLTLTHNWYNNISMFYPIIDLKNVRCIK